MLRFFWPICIFFHGIINWQFPILQSSVGRAGACRVQPVPVYKIVKIEIIANLIENFKKKR